MSSFVPVATGAFLVLAVIAILVKIFVLLTDKAKDVKPPVLPANRWQQEAEDLPFTYSDGSNSADYPDPPDFKKAERLPDEATGNSRRS